MTTAQSAKDACNTASTAESLTWEKSSYQLPTAMKSLRLERADDLVHFRSQPLHRVRRPHGDRTAQSRRTCRTDRTQHGDQRRPGGDPVVDHDHGTVGDQRSGPTRPIRHLSTLDFLTLTGHFGVDVGLRNPQPAHNIVVDERFTIAGNGSDGELGVAGSSHLVRHHHAQFAPSMVCDLGRHGHPAPGYPQNEWRRFEVSVTGRDDRCAQPGPGIGSIAIPHDPSVPHHGR